MFTSGAAMTHFLQRSALILLATTTLGVSPVLARVHHGHKAPAASKAGDGERVSYVVKRGDTLEKIAARLGTTIPELMRANNLKKTSVLQPGDTLKGPVVEKPAAKSSAGKKAKAAAEAPQSYTVSKGDTVFAIAKKFGVSIEDLRKENHLSSRSQIRAGQKLRVPGGDEAAAPDKADETPATSAKATKGRRGKASSDEASSNDRAGSGDVITTEGKRETYRVRKGDTLAKVAAKLGVSVSQLKAENGLKGSALPRGKVLKGARFTEHAYIARSGDTVASIAQRFSVSTASLRAENQMSRRATVRPGQKVFLPDDYRDRERGAGARSERPAPSERPSRSYPRPAEPDISSSTLPARPIPYAPSGSTPTSPPPAASTPTSTPPPTDTQVSQMARGRFMWPLKGDLLGDFGLKPTGQRNDGIDIQAEAGASVRSAADGDVVYAGDQVPGFGNLVLIKHSDGWVTAYGHLSRIDVKMQQKVTQGQQIGQAGTSGGVTEPQLHFEVRYAPNPLERARPVDPKLVLPK
jgi:murein DD-endopeptidase MepM/ murein hydrolase activator NlpD